jgi:hypothetical protein
VSPEAVAVIVCTPLGAACGAITSTQIVPLNRSIWICPAALFMSNAAVSVTAVCVGTPTRAIPVNTIGGPLDGASTLVRNATKPLGVSPTLFAARALA